MTLVLQWRQPDPPIILRWRGPTDEMIAAVAASPETVLAAVVGPPGAAGGGVEWIDGEIPTGTKNGVNRVFTLAHAPTWLVLAWNGMVQTVDIDFTLSGATITFLRDGPAADDVLSASYSRE
jgi:hypothetical protein